MARQRHRGLRARVRSDESGASLVEFALVLPLLAVLLFGIMEAGWAFAQSVEVRNAAREGARLAVVDYGDHTQIINEVCNRADLSGSGATITVTINGGGESVTVEIDQTYSTLTGFMDPFFNGLSLKSEVEMRAERTLAKVTNGSAACP